MILLVDNYDSFSYNLYQLVGTITPEITVVRNDALSVDEVKAMRPDAIILSPGPGRPEGAGICIELVKALGEKTPVLGVCLGHQAIVCAYGGIVEHAKHLMHGKQSKASLTGNSPVFFGLPETIPVARYHSLSAKEEGLPDALTVTARSEDKEIMAVQHTKYPVYGLQFHPESILTPDGVTILRNFLNLSVME